MTVEIHSSLSTSESQIKMSTLLKDNFEDANNNNNNNNNNNISEDSGFQNQSKLSNEQNSSNSGAEDWQILDADEEESTNRLKNVGKMFVLKKQVAFQEIEDTSLLVDETLGDSKKKKKENKNENENEKKYIEINPLGPQKYSKRLIFLSTAIYSLMPLTSALASLTLLLLLFTKYYPITLTYFCYVFYTRNHCNTGGSRIRYIYKHKFWSHLAAYFPVKLRYTKNFHLSSSENYILNYHPHGISAFGAVTVFGTNGLNLSELFPGIKSRFMVHETSFVMPVMKETFSFRGDCSVNSKSIDYMLSKEGKGNLLCIVGGGLAEADLSDAEILKIVVAQRKGFVKKALIHGSNLIPCIAFGENSVFHKVNFKRDSLLHKLESKWYQVFKFKHPIYYGRSLISEKFKGVMPLKRPITVVLGDPILVEKNEKPTQDVIDNLHSKYLKQLQAMYNSNSDLCATYDKKLELI